MNFNTIAISADKNIKLHTVRLFGSENNEYSVKLGVQDVNEIVGATDAGDFLSKLVQSETGNYQGFEIVFDPPIALQENIEHSLVAEITGPPSWFGVNGRSTKCGAFRCQILVVSVGLNNMLKKASFLNLCVH